MVRGRLKPLKYLTKCQIRNKVSQNLLPYFYVFLFLHFPESSESNNSSLDTSQLTDSSSEGDLREYASAAACAFNEDDESVTSSIQSETEQDKNTKEQDDINNENEIENLRSFLKAWATDYEVTQSQQKPLLAKLKEHECFSEQILKDPRTLLGTSSTKTCMQTIKHGVYYHFRLKAGIEEVHSNNAHRISRINIKIGIDGVPISKSSKATFWPILATVEPFGEVFIVGLYFGYEKPILAEDFLDEFLAETEDLCNNGFNFRGEMLKCKIKCIIADVPAKAYILIVKSHTGFHSCTKCKIRGKWKRHTVCFPNVRRQFPRRTDVDLRHCRHRKH